MAIADRGSLHRRGVRLEYLTIAWNVIEDGVAIASGIAAGSIALVGFGLDSFTEVFAAMVVLWQLRGVDEQRERRALRLIAVTFYALAVYVTIESVLDLIGDAEPHTSLPGLTLAALSLVVMPILALAKHRTGRQLDSATILADSKETLLCTYLSAALVVGLGFNATLGWWCADPLAALVVACSRHDRDAKPWKAMMTKRDALPQATGTSRLASRARTRWPISSRIGRTASTSWPAGSSSAQSS